jgi:hypothetical protein
MYKLWRRFWKTSEYLALLEIQNAFLRDERNFYGRTRTLMDLVHEVNKTSPVAGAYSLMQDPVSHVIALWICVEEDQQQRTYDALQNLCSLYRTELK